MDLNEEKTEICLFYKRDHPTVEVRVNGKRILSKKTINVLGVLFDSKLQWSDQASKAISNSKRALPGIKILKRYLTKDETKMLIVVDVEFHPNPNFISSANKSEPSDKATSHKAILLFNYLYV